MENQKPWLILALNQEFAKERGLKPKAMKVTSLGAHVRTWAQAALIQVQ